MTLMSRVREHTYTVVENEAVGDGIWRMVFRAPKLAGSLEPGQFMNFHVPGAKQILRVPLSFASADAGSGTIEIVYAVVGDATRALTRMAVGESSSVLGPSGNGWDRARSWICWSVSATALTPHPPVRGRCWSAAAWARRLPSPRRGFLPIRASPSTECWER